MIPRVAIRSFYLIAIGVACVAQGQAEPKPIRIAIFADKGSAGKGVPNVTTQLSKRSDLQVSKLKGAEIANGALKDFDVVIFTGGSAHSQADALGDKGRQEVRRFVKEGGGYVGICAGAYLACSGFDWGLGVLNAKTVSSKWQRGKGQVQIEATPLGQEVIQLPAEKHEILYANGPIIMPDQRQDLPAYESLAFFRSELAEHDSPKGAMVNSPAMVRADFGQGKVISSSPHPEQTSGMEDFIEHAVRWVAKRDQPKVSGAQAADAPQGICR